MNELNKEETLVLVDEQDNQIGFAGKKEVHSKGLLHRAFSIFIFNSKGELILQKRAKSKYHSGGLWTNTCCGHPTKDENTSDAAARRLREEMNIETELHHQSKFQYRSNLENGLIENEIDHVFYGVTDQTPVPNPDEADDWRYIKPIALISDINYNPDNYTSWLNICIDRKIFSKLIEAI